MHNRLLLAVSALALLTASAAAPAHAVILSSNSTSTSILPTHIITPMPPIAVVEPPVSGGSNSGGGTTTNKFPAVSVYPDKSCLAPPAAPTGTVHYIDPVHGSMTTGDGTLAHPWHTLQEVVDDMLFANAPSHWDNIKRVMIKNNPNAPIKSGDTVYLLSGNHGTVTFQGMYGGTALLGYNNSSFITIAALPGNAPVLNQLTVGGASKFRFTGLTIESINNTGKFMTGYGTVYQDYNLVHLAGLHDNIVLDHNTLLSQSDTSKWTITDWQMKRASGVVDNTGGGTCISVSNNNLKNVGFGIISQRNDKILITGNTINYFSDDGVDYGSNDMLIENNYITNSIEDGDGFHRDGMQGQPLTEQTVLTNITIKNNTVIRLTDPNNPHPGFLQGIDCFDGMLENVVVTGNKIVTDAGQGLAYYGVKNATIKDNIILGDNGKVLPCYNLNLTQCLPLKVVTLSTFPMLDIHDSKAGGPSENVVVSNNIVSELGPEPSTVNLTLTNNLGVLNPATGKGLFEIPASVTGKTTEWVGKPGTYAGNNVISQYTPEQMFTMFDPVHMKYNLTMKSGMVMP